MVDGAELTTVDEIYDEGSYLCTVSDSFDLEEEIIVVPCETDDAESANDDATNTVDSAATDDEGRRVTAWLNRCTHEPQRFDTGNGVPMRDNQIICPRHGSLFDACSGYCGNGDAADTTLPDVEVAVENGIVYLADDGYEFEHEGGIDSSDGPGSTSHLGF